MPLNQTPDFFCVSQMMAQTIKLLATEEIRIDKSDCSFEHLCGFHIIVNALNVHETLSECI